MEKLKLLIEKMVLAELKILFEKDEMDLAKDASSDTPGAVGDAPPDEENIDSSGGGLEDLASDLGDGTDSTDGTDETDGTGSEDTDGTDEADGGFGSGGFGAGRSSGGGGFGSGNAFGDDSEDDSEADSTEDGEKSPDEAEAQTVDSGDPVQEIINIAKDLRTKTGDAQQILNTVKPAIQEKFSNFEDAVSIIQLLWETNEPVLLVVARKLILFIKGN